MYSSYIHNYTAHIVFSLFTVHPTASQSLPMLNFSQQQEESSYHVPATPEYISILIIYICTYMLVKAKFTVLN